LSLDQSFFTVLSAILIGIGEGGMKVCQLHIISKNFSGTYSMTMALAVFSGIVPTLVYQIIVATWDSLMLDKKIVDLPEINIHYITYDFDKEHFLTIETYSVIASYIFMMIALAV